MANSGSAAILSAHLPESGATRIFGASEPAITAGMLAPTGLAKPVDGGYLVTGRYGFASGSAHANWICAGARIDDEQKTGIMLAVPRAEVEFLGNWDVYGLRGTGSVDYRLESVFVPKDAVFLREGAVPLRGQPSLGLGLLVGLIGHLGVALGTAKRALEEVVGIADMGRGRPGMPPMREQPHFLHEFVVTEGKYRAARAYSMEVLVDAVDSLRDGGPLSRTRGNRVQQATTLGVRMASEVVSACYSWSGSVGLRRPHPLGRLMGEMTGQSQHGLVDPNSLVFAGPGLMDDYRH
ncbi:MAG: Pigment production hydroxylase, partial [Microbacteriaceae bacterium]|nr:Pigment production hydroxylase [Microbacteriaceae bacterium]